MYHLPSPATKATPHVSLRFQCKYDVYQFFFLLNELTQKASFQQQQIKVVHYKYTEALGTPNGIRK